MLYDRGTGWVQCYPKGSKTKEDTIDALNDFVGADKVAKFYSDNAGELQEAAKWLGWPRAKAVPGDHQSTGLAERFVGDGEGGRKNAALLVGLGSVVVDTRHPVLLLLSQY